VRKFLAVIVTPLVILAGCGGGSGTTTNPPGSGGGGGGGGGTQVIATPGPPNVEALVVDQGPNALTTPAVNTSFVSVTVCLPGTSTCQTIDHIEVDTGSSGLRILQDATTTVAGVSFNLALPPVMDPSNASNHVAECMQFADGFSWGSVNKADIKLPVSGKTATNVIVQVIGAQSAGDPSKASPTCLPPPPINANNCNGLENTVPCFGANGILGVGPFVNDCDSTNPCPFKPIPPTCTTVAPIFCFPGNSATYFSCTSAGTCAQVAPNVITPQLQLPNPAVLFTTDNNGVVIELPAVGATGAPAPLNGSLVFGIGTLSNNALGSATKLPMCYGGSEAMCTLNSTPLFGTVSATLSGFNGSLVQSYLDSGSNSNFFPTQSIPSCTGPNAGFLCPTNPSTVNESATLTGTDGTTATADFSIANADSLFMENNAMNFAFSNLDGSNYSTTLPNATLDLGLSFFYGRNVFTGFEDLSTNPATAPYFAY
jgi:hypothetical protein